MHEFMKPTNEITNLDQLSLIVSRSIFTFLLLTLRLAEMMSHGVTFL